MSGLEQSDPSSFTRYLLAKKSIDDRALNRFVWQSLACEIAARQSESPIRVLEVGAGAGAFVERALEWGLLTDAEYTALDSREENIAFARQWLPEWGATHGFQVKRRRDRSLSFERQGQRLLLRLEAIDLFDFIRREKGNRQWDLLMAHAFLDLVDIPTTLPRLFDLSYPGGLFYFAINFDGITLLEPIIDAQLDELIQALYHRTMDERRVSGVRSGDSRAGRHLFSQLRQAGARIKAAGASDWVVFPTMEGYTQDEVFFLNYILSTIECALAGNPELDPSRFASWLAERRAQIGRGELIYIAHQLDFMGNIVTLERPR